MMSGNLFMNAISNRRLRWHPFTTPKQIYLKFILRKEKTLFIFTMMGVSGGQEKMVHFM
jgi:hypothetical protein